MRTRLILIPASAAVLLFVAAALADVVVPKLDLPKPPRPAATAAATAASSAGARPAQPEPQGPAKPLAAAPPSADKTPPPKLDEWKTAEPVELAHDVAACRATRVREWLKIRCDGFPAAGVSLLAGPRDGVEVWVDPRKEGDSAEIMKSPRPSEVIFPLRRGDGRIFQIGQFGPGWDGPIGWNVAYTISEQWVEGEAAPIVTIR